MYNNIYWMWKLKVFEKIRRYLPCIGVNMSVVQVTYWLSVIVSIMSNVYKVGT